LHDRYDEAGFFLLKFEGMGRKLDAFEARGAAAYLYELDGKEGRRYRKNWGIRAG
jgi:hypothetical protein